MTDLDVRLFLGLHDALGGSLLPLMAALTVVGGGWGALSIFPLFVPSRTRRFAAWFVATIVANAVLVYTLKSAVGRPRPWTVLPHVQPLVFPGPTDFSFPSGHAAGSFAYATFIAVVLLRVRPGRSSRAAAVLLFVLAGGVALSRVALGVHFPADVAAGAIVGATVGALGARLYLRRELVARLREHVAE